jgi:hypothetical protein
MRISALLTAMTLVLGCSSSDNNGGSTNNGTNNTNNATTATNNATTATNNATTNTNNATTTNNSTAGTNNVVTPDDCTDEEVFVSDYCQRCGPANGCDSAGPECRPACSEEGESCPTGGVCFDGACRRLCG